MSKEVKRATIAVDGVFDIETQGWDKFLCGCLYRRGQKPLVYTWEREKDLVAAILFFKGTLWAHNGGRFDALWLLRNLVEMDARVKAEIIVSGQSVISIRIGDLTIRDSARLLPMTLNHAASMVGGSKLKLDFPCNCKIYCGGYCQFSREMPRARLNEVIDYMVEDCRLTMAVLDYVKNYAEENDLDLRGTIGASAWATAARRYDLPVARWKSREQYFFARGSYYGGRVQVFRPQADSGRRYDINSAYPAALTKTVLPCGKMLQTQGFKTGLKFWNGYEGVYEATVKIDPTFIPPLPYRTKQRVAYPVGEFRGIWTRIELLNATTMAGLTIVKWHRGLSWSDSKPLLKPFAEYIWDLRAKAIAATPSGKKHGLAQFLKLFANSATGKFAQRPDTDKVLMTDEPRGCRPEHDCLDGVLHGVRRCCKHRCYERCGRDIPLDPHSGQEAFWVRRQFQFHDCGHVQWSAYLTSRARIDLHGQLTGDYQGGKTAVYCDTDSVFTTSSRTWEIGDGLGQWAEEGAFSDFVSLAPKVYAYRDEKDRFVARAKGIPNAEDQWAKIVAGQAVAIDKGVNSFKTAVAKGDLFQRKDAQRRIIANTTHYGDRITSGEVTLPQKVEDLCPVPLQTA